MFKTKNFILIAVMSVAPTLWGQVKIQDTGFVETERSFLGKEKLIQKSRTMKVFNNGPVSYKFQYCYIDDPSKTGRNYSDSKVKFPYVGDATTGSSGIGLLDDAWYSGGFLGIDVNGKGLSSTIASDIKVKEEDQKGSVTFYWKSQWGETTAKFVCMNEDDKIYAEITLKPEVAVKQLKYRLSAIPGHLPEHSKIPAERWFSTGIRSVKNHPEIDSLDVQNENWVFLFDSQSNKGKGSCAVLFIPEEIESAQVDQKSNYCSSVYLKCPPDSEKIHLLIWNFPDKYKDQTEAYEYLKENGKTLLEGLKKFDFNK